MVHVLIISRSCCGGDVVDDDVGDAKLLAAEMMVCDAVWLGGETTPGDQHEQSRVALPQKPNSHSPSAGSQAREAPDNPVSCSQMHTGVRGGVDYDGNTNRERRQKTLTRFGVSLAVAGKSYI